MYSSFVSFSVSWRPYICVFIYIYFYIYVKHEKKIENHAFTSLVRESFSEQEVYKQSVLLTKINIFFSLLYVFVLVNYLVIIIIIFEFPFIFPSHRAVLWG